MKMLKISGSEDYYPTPESLLREITKGLDWGQIDDVLEPSAGRGNICEYVMRHRKEHFHKTRGWINTEVDCIEIEPEFRAILKSKNFRVVHDNFLTFRTYKHYDLIIMNPPFSIGARHLLKAIEIQEKSGGGIICILNAETIRNPYTNERKELAQKLKEYGAEIKYYEDAFIVAERATDVEVASVNLIIPEPERKTTIYETLRERSYEEKGSVRENSNLAESDLVASFVAQYNQEVEWGLRLYDELLELQSKVLDGKSNVTLEITTGEDYDAHKEKFSVNEYVKKVRRKYWNKFFREPRFIGRLTSNLQEKYLSQVEEFSYYDFSYYNIKTVQIELSQQLIKGVK